MRFEVRGGGIAAILFAMTLLSGAVFVLGLLAGYDVGRQTQIDSAQLATSYPLESPPSSAAPSNGPSSGTKNAVVQTSTSTGAPMVGEGRKSQTAGLNASDSTSAGESVKPQSKPVQTSENSPRPRLASASAAGPSASAADSATDDDDLSDAESENRGAADTPSGPTSGPEQNDSAVATTAPSTRHKAYNIQIEAAMDISGADRMMARLQKLGYPSHLVPTAISGQRWYKVEIGPYATPEVASRAETELRQKYNATYGGVAQGSSSGGTGAGDNSEE